MFLKIVQIFCLKIFYRFSLNRSSGPFQSLSCNFRLPCVCVCVSVPSRKSCFPVNCKLLVEDSIANIVIPLSRHFGFLLFRLFLGKQKWVFWSLETSLLCQTCINTRNTSIPPRVLSFKVVFVSKFNLMEDRFLLLFGPLSEGLDLISRRYM